MTKSRTDAALDGVMRPIAALVCLLLGILLAVALFDYKPDQCPQLSTAIVGQNLVGALGSVVAFWSFRLLGCVAWLPPLFLLWLFYAFLFKNAHIVTWKKYTCMVLALLACAALMTLWEERLALHTTHLDILYSSGFGGMIGKLIFLGFLEKFLGVFGSTVLLLLGSTLLLLGSLRRKGNARQTVEKWVCFTGDQLTTVSRTVADGVTQISKKTATTCTQSATSGWKRLCDILGHHFKAKSASNEALEDIFIINKKEATTQVNQKIQTFAPLKSVTLSAASSTAPTNEMTPKIGGLKIVNAEGVEKCAPPIPVSENYIFPPLSLLMEGNDERNIDTAEHEETAAKLVEKLAEFGVVVTVDEVHTGPVITRYEVSPAKGVRVEKILNLDKNIALGLKATSVRILAPVPGKGCVGIELPNKTPQAVCLRDIIESKAWAESNAEIPIVLGKEVTGKPLITDLAKMPHLLIAGATGSGKTVCINAIIASLVYHASPEDLRFIMVDPKIVEMKVYNDLPHMLIPVVTEPKKVPGALKWLIAEMERRYKIFAEVGARNIASFNEKILNAASNEYKKLPYIVCIIDELADLMMVAPADIETCVARLAQLARAAGIHLILATQRPSVNVITGVIKANLPSRIAFKVASKVDSRTILDGNGADQLIGRGDMLFTPPGSASVIRAQGAFVSDEEINAIVAHLARNGPPQFAVDVQEQVEAAAIDEDNPIFDEDEDDPMLGSALEVLRNTQRASTSILQRRLKIGYNRAARIMDILEHRGYVGPENGAQPREILKELVL